MPLSQDISEITLRFKHIAEYANLYVNSSPLIPDVIEIVKSLDKLESEIRQQIHIMTSVLSKIQNENLTESERDDQNSIFFATRSTANSKLDKYEKKVSELKKFIGLNDNAF